MIEDLLDHIQTQILHLPECMFHQTATQRVGHVENCLAAKDDCRHVVLLDKQAEEVLQLEVP